MDQLVQRWEEAPRCGVVLKERVDAVSAKYHDFIVRLCHRPSMPPHCCYVPADRLLQTIIKSLIEVVSLPVSPFLPGRNVHYLETEDEIYREIIVHAV